MSTKIESWTIRMEDEDGSPLYFLSHDIPSEVAVRIDDLIAEHYAVTWKGN